MIEVVHARGHENVRALHKTTLEFTKEEHLSPRGDCIVAISASKGLKEFSDSFKRKLKTDGAKVRVLIECAGIKEEVNAYGSKDLILTHPTDLVIRKSSFICARTLAINADKASKDLSRELVKALADENDVKVTVSV